MNKRPLLILAVLASMVVMSACGAAGGDTGDSESPVAESPVTESPVVTPEPTEAPKEPITIAGVGTSKSAPFAIAGNYQVSWTATPGSDAGCFHGVNLQRVDGQILLETLASELIGGAAEVAGSTNLYNLDATDYYVDATSGCDAWSFVFTPLQ